MLNLESMFGKENNDPGLPENRFSSSQFRHWYLTQSPTQQMCVIQWCSSKPLHLRPEIRPPSLLQGFDWHCQLDGVLLLGIVQHNIKQLQAMPGQSLSTFFLFQFDLKSKKSIDDYFTYLFYNTARYAIQIRSVGLERLRFWNFLN